MQLRLLLSYWDIACLGKGKKGDLAKLLSTMLPTPIVFIDSGAFSAFRKRTPIDVVEYGRWLMRYQSLIDLYANLDVIGNAGLTWDNQRRLEDAGLRPLPVVHANAPLSELDRYTDAGYRYIGIGGLVGVGSAARVHKLQQIRRHLKATAPGVVFHAFGVTSPRVVEAVPLFSIDSVSWKQSILYGTMQLWDRASSQFERVNYRDRKSILTHARLLEEYGLRVDKLMAGLQWREAGEVTVHSWLAFHNHLRRRHGDLRAPKTFPKLHHSAAVRAPGPHLYFASHCYPLVRLALEVAKSIP